MHRTLAARALFPALLLFCMSVPAQDSTDIAPAMADSLMKVRQAEMMRLSQPGPEHELLAKYEGTFDMEINYYMAPGQDPMAMSGVATNRMILDDRFLEMASEGDMGGFTMKALSILGFDRRHKVFTVTGFDNTGTYSVSAQGEYDEETRTITLSGADEDPVFGFVQEYDFVMELIDDDTFTWAVTFFNPEMTQGEDEFTMVEIRYTRKK